MSGKALALPKKRQVKLKVPNASPKLASSMTNMRRLKDQEGQGQDEGTSVAVIGLTKKAEAKRLQRHQTQRPTNIFLQKNQQRSGRRRANALSQLDQKTRR